MKKAGVVFIFLSLNMTQTFASLIKLHFFAIWEKPWLKINVHLVMFSVRQFKRDEAWVEVTSEWFIKIINLKCVQNVN